MLDMAYDRLWSLGIQLRDRAKTLRALRPLEPAILYLAAHVFPPPTTEVVAQVAGGMLMHVPPGYPSARSFAAGRYESAVTSVFGAIVRQGMTVLDAGANVGYYSLIASALVGASGHVFAFEPDPLNFQYLMQNLLLNSCSNASAFQIALSGHHGSGTFVPDSAGAEGFLSNETKRESGLIVSITTLDQFLADNGWPTVDFIKLDVEGSEPDVLRGMRETSRRNPRLQLVMELNLRALARGGETTDSVATLLQELGFESYRVIELHQRPVSVAAGLPKTRATYNLHVVKA